MKKTLLIFTMILVILSVSGCGSKTPYSFADLEKDLKELDADVKVNQKPADLVGAEEGYSYVFDECSIEVYKFDTSSDSYKKAESEQEINLEILDVKFDAKVKNGYGYFIEEERAKCDEQVKLVKKLMK